MDRYLTIPELAKSWHVSTAAIRKFIRRPKNPLPTLMAGRKYLIAEREALSWSRDERQRHEAKLRLANGRPAPSAR